MHACLLALCVVVYVYPWLHDHSPLTPVDNQDVMHYIRDKTAVPYFSNLVWFIGSHVIELDKCVQTDEE